MKRSSKKTIILTILTFLTGLLVGAFIYISQERLTITINGQESILLEYNSVYKDQGATIKICKFNDCKETKIKATKSNVNTTKVGEYKVLYKTTHKDKTYTKTRLVNIVDTVPPTITLTGKTSTNVCPNATYKEEGYEATDAYDGELTDKVKVTTNKEEIIYEVFDSSNNKYKVIRKLNYIDKTKPVITLKGSKSTTVSLNGIYNEPGYIVTDNCETIDSKEVKISGTIDTKKEGVYTLTYTVSDKAGNKTSITRKVSVKKVPTFNTEDKNEYQKALENYIVSKNYKVSIGYVNLKTGYTYTYKADKVYYGASLVKTVDALYIYEKTNFDEATRLKVKKAISVSDNTAHRQLVRQIGLSNLRNYGRSLGAKNFLTGSSSDYFGYTTVNDQIAIWKHVNKVIKTNPKGIELKSYFINDFYNNLNFKNGPTVMHKYGWYGSYYHDVGIIFGEEPYIVVILTNHGNGSYASIVNDLSKKIYGLNKIDG